MAVLDETEMQRLRFNNSVDALTGYQSSQWARAGYPGLQNKNLEEFVKWKKEAGFSARNK